MNATLMLCTDLDRTLIPNGPSSGSRAAMREFDRLVQRPEVTLAFVTGRNLDQVRSAVRE